MGFRTKTLSSSRRRRVCKVLYSVTTSRPDESPIRKFESLDTSGLIKRFPGKSS